MDYTNLYEFQTDSGMIVPSDQSVLLGIQTKFQEIFGTDLDLSAETPVGRLVEAFAILTKSTLGVTAQSANQFNINYATGIYLDSIAQIFGLSRIPATASNITVRCFFSGVVNGTPTVPRGALISDSATGTTYSIDSPIERTQQVDVDTGYYIGIGTATAVTTGPNAPQPNSVTHIQSSIQGWVGVTNTGINYVGTDIETDAAFRRRILEARPVGVGFASTLISALSRVTGVYSNCLLENNTGTDVVKKGIGIPPHSIYVGVDFIDTEETQDAIARVIGRTKPLGVGMVSEDVPAGTRIYKQLQYGYAEGSFQQDIYFYKTIKTGIVVDLRCYSDGYTGIDMSADVVDVISKYLSTIGVGETVFGTNIAKQLATQLNVGVMTLLLQKEGSTIPAGGAVEMMGYESPTTSTDLVTVTIVS